MHRFVFLLTLASLSLVSSVDAGYLFKDGRFIHTKEMATLPVEEHYSLGMTALQNQNWEEAVYQFRIVIINFPDSSWGKEAFYFLGVSYFHHGDKDLANENFSKYLHENANPKYFEESFRYKLAIGDAFKKGEKRHLFGYENLPQWMPDKDHSITIYDEVIQSLPNHELSAKALLAKADHLRKELQFRPAIENLQLVIRKFPKSEYASKAYAHIAKVYLEQAKQDSNNPDILQLALINKKKFTQEFPRDKKLPAIESGIAEMKELFATALYETGQLYERKKQPKAAVLYYHNATTQFPDTKIALLCKERLTELHQHAEELTLSIP
jgi:outer membrane protein assembly factor BamD (BamD/ComL family)